MSNFKNVDMNAVDIKDSDYLVNKGAELYTKGDYKTAIEYYRLAASFNNIRAISNLGYCYMYGRSIEENMDIAILYFKIAANEDDIEALYKLGDIYRNGRKGVKKDIDLGLYYLKKAESLINEYGEFNFLYHPSLALILAKEYMSGEFVKQDLYKSYCLLDRANDGYKREISEGAEYYTSCLKEVQNMMELPILEDARKRFQEEWERIDD